MGYKYFSVDSYSKDLNISSNNPVFGIYEDLPDAQPVKEDNDVEIEQLPSQMPEISDDEFQKPVKQVKKHLIG